MESKHFLLYYTGSLSALEISEAVDALEKTFPVEVELGGEIEPDKRCFNELRRQYISDCLLHQIKLIGERDRKKIWIVDTDIYTNGLNFVFGQAELNGKAAVVSVKRLKGGLESREIYLKRLRTEVVHETGHIFGLEHCPNPYCVMFFSNNLADTDRKGDNLCAVCREKLRIAYEL
ncbi:MAG: archaemetzincin family Zn-dependent metalloprotease [Actinobacteria bacterium]|nr:archaemetzincin family Zn-dependent metalloprotease [Actinomycetota bacterium]